MLVQSQSVFNTAKDCEIVLWDSLTAFARCKLVRARVGKNAVWKYFLAIFKKPKVAETLQLWRSILDPNKQPFLKPVMKKLPLLFLPLGPITIADIESWTSRSQM